MSQADHRNCIRVRMPVSFHPARTSSSRLRCSQLLIFLVAIFGCGSEVAKLKEETSNRSQTKSEELPEVQRKASSFRALKLLEGNRFDEAWDECQKVLLQSPNDSRALYVAANILKQRDRIDQALQMVDRITLTDPEYGLMAHRDAVKWSNSNARFAETERRAKQLLSVHPKDVETIKTLAAALDIQGRRFEASHWMQRMVELGQVDINTLVLAVDTVKPVQSDEIVAKLMESNPDAPRLQGSYAFGLLFEKKPEEAEILFRKALEDQEPSAAVQVGLGQAIIEQERYGDFAAWLATVPRDELESLPSYWRILGIWFQRMNDYPNAIYCFTRSVELDPMDYLAIGPLAQSLAADGQTENGVIAESLYQRMQLANRNINYSRDGFRRPEWMLQVADALQDIGRDIESLAWRELCETANEGDSKKIASLRLRRLELSARGSNVALKSLLPWETGDWTAPDLEQAIAKSKSVREGDNRVSPGTRTKVQATLRWEDVAESINARFQYRNGDDPDVLGMQTYQSNGAGAGAIDFDRDGWADLYVLQGGGDPRQPDSNSPSALFRNRDGIRFEEVAAKAQATNLAYGQGVAVGDWDQDGFADMFILNFGQNRLLRNMGDGTFEQVDVPDMHRDIENDPVWSVSGAIADINGDHLPDLVEVNYASGIDVITHQCLNKNGVPQVCRPTEFPASQDFIYLSDGQGGFSIGNPQWQLELDDGRGLGVIVGNLDGLFGNDIYIANDMSANNLLLSRENPTRAGEFMVSDEAVRRGCAVDIQGKPQASMGVGCADVDRNGELDLFMTNFIDEYNAIYLQSSRFFQDASRRYRLIDPKKKTLGFGAQLIDLDLDGWQDAVVVNGHVDDYRALGQPYEMKPQVFLQQDRSFEELPSESLGRFFTKTYLSRSLGIWDFNRDGKPDWYVTHLDHPLSILRNDSQSDGAWVALELIGVESERDAVGAVVRVFAASEKWMHQRLAGNGFECSNEPWIFLGLGKSQTIDRLEIDWPSGTRSVYESMDVNRRYRIWESNPQVEAELLR
jgi:tetratricopeptide (TPR) repeat protein